LISSDFNEFFIRLKRVFDTDIPCPQTSFTRLKYRVMCCPESLNSPA
jgi:hypothetical protein